MDRIPRQEDKYLISIMNFLEIKNNLMCYLDLDKHSGSEGYLIKSLYFDTIYDECVLHALDGLLKKSKIRLRYYNGNPVNIKLEIKSKDNTDGYKNNVILTRDQACMMLNGDYRFLLNIDSAFATTIYATLCSGVYFPKSIVEYQRQAFSYPGSTTRVTFDTNVRASHDVTSFLDKTYSYYPILDPDMGVLEIKYDYYLQSLIKEVVKPLNMSRVAMSKYLNSRFLI